MRLTIPEIYELMKASESEPHFATHFDVIVLFFAHLVNVLVNRGIVLGQ
jgi:hypothetical protein